MSTLKANSYQHVDRASPSITINSDGSVSISSTVTYEDVTSVDAVGVITGRSNADLQNRVNVGSGVSIKAGGLNVSAGIATFNNGLNITGNISNGLNVSAGISTVQALQATTGSFTGNLTISNVEPTLNLTDTNQDSDFAVRNNDGTFGIRDTTNGVERFTIASDGTASVPGDVSIADKIIHTGDTNTAIRFPAADTFSVETAGSERLRITSAGSVGIGTAAPAYKFHVETSGSAALGRFKRSDVGAALFQIMSQDGGNVVLALGDGTDPDIQYIKSDNSDNSLSFGSNAAERLRITSAGLVGIGTDNPSQLLSLQSATPRILLSHSGAGSTAAVTNCYVDYATSGSLEISVDDNNAIANSKFQVRVDGATAALTLDSSGRLLLGTTTEGQASADDLTVATTGATGITVRSGTSSNGNIFFSDGTSGGDEYRGYVQYQHGVNSLELGSNGATALIINTSQDALFAGIVTATDFIADSQITHKNMVDNGGMVIAQRDQTASGSCTTAAVKTCDRFVWVAVNTDQASFDISQEPMNQAVPGLSRYLKVTPGTAETSDAANEYFAMYTTLEAQQLQRLKYGTASAETCTLSFWVKSSNTGTFCVNFYKMDATGYMTTRLYTVDAADTWERKTITIPGLTASGIANDSGNGLRIHWILDAGSDYKGTNSGSSWVGATNAAFAYGHNINMINNTSKNWNITGIQFEIGSEATPFEVLPYTIDLQRCMRYYQQFGGSNTTLGRLPMMGECTSSTVAQYPLKFSVPMRGTSAPTLVSGTASNYKVYSGNSSTNATAVAIAVGFKNQEPYGDIWGIRLNLSVASGLSAGHAAQAYNSTTGDVLGFDAEFPS